MEIESIIRQPDMCGNMASDLQQFPDVTLPSSEERALTAEEFYLPLQATCARTPCPSQLSTVILLIVSLIDKQDQDFDVLSFTFLVLQGSSPRRYFQRCCNSHFICEPFLLSSCFIQIMSPYIKMVFRGWQDRYNVIICALFAWKVALTEWQG